MDDTAKPERSGFPHQRFTPNLPPRPRQRGALISSSQEQPHPTFVNSRPRQRGAILPTIQEEPPVMTVPPKPRQRGALQPHVTIQREFDQSFEIGSSSQSLGCTNAQLYFLELQRRNGVSSLQEIKVTFAENWLRLEDTLQSHESILDQMKAEMDKSFLELKAAKEAALKEKEELEASRDQTMEALDLVKQEAGKARNVREDLEHISTDLSVQLAELNHMQKQVHEQQATLEELISMKVHNKAQDRRDNVRIEAESIAKDLQKCEAKLPALEAELARNRLATEKLAQAVLRHTADLGAVQVSAKKFSDGDGYKHFLSKQSRFIDADIHSSDVDLDNRDTSTRNWERQPLKRLPHHDGGDFAFVSLGESNAKHARW